MRSTIILMLTWACGSGPIDARQRVGLVPDDDWTGDQIEALSRAGDAWNQEFGTQLQVGGDPDGGEVKLRFTKDGCQNERFQRTLARTSPEPAEVNICPSTADDPNQFFETMRHELGHALGIPKHAKSASAVMTALATFHSHWFQAEDWDLFFAANPRFEAQTSQ